MSEKQSEIKIIESHLIHWKTVTQSWLHSRKALITLVAFGIATAAFFTGKLTGDQWVAFTKWAIPSYLASNIADGAVEKFMQKQAEESA